MAGWNDSETGGPPEPQDITEKTSRNKWRNTAAAAVAAAVALLLLAISIAKASNGIAFVPLPVAVEQSSVGIETGETGDSIQYTAVGCMLYDMDGFCVKLTGTASDGMNAWLKVETTNNGKEERAVSLTRVTLNCGVTLLQSDKVFVAAGESAILEIEVPGGTGDVLPMTGYVAVQESQDLKYAGAVVDSKRFKVKG